MTVENATYINELNPALPAGGDPKSEGDNHFRLIKDALQNSLNGSSYPRALKAWADKDPSVVSTTTNLTADAADDGKLVLCNATAGPLTMTLPDPAIATSMLIWFKKTDISSNTVTIVSALGNIDGGVFLLLENVNDFRGVWCDGTNWFVIATSAGSGGGGDVTNPMTTPLDVGGQDIFSGTDVDITLAPGGVGDVVLGNFRFDVGQTVGAGTDGYTLTYDHVVGKILLEPPPASGPGNTVEVQGIGPMPASIPAGSSIPIVVTDMSGITNAAWVISLLHVPSTDTDIDARAVISADNTVTVTLINKSTSSITGLSGNVTVRARTLAGAPGLRGSAPIPASIAAGEEVDVVVPVVGATSNYAVPIIHVLSTNTDIEKRGVVTADGQITVTLTNKGTTEITGLTGNITAIAWSI